MRACINELPVACARPLQWKRFAKSIRDFYKTLRHLTFLTHHNRSLRGGPLHPSSHFTRIAHARRAPAGHPPHHCAEPATAPSETHPTLLLNAVCHSDQREESALRMEHDTCLDNVADAPARKHRRVTRRRLLLLFRITIQPGQARSVSRGVSLRTAESKMLIQMAKKLRS